MSLDKIIIQCTEGTYQVPSNLRAYAFLAKLLRTMNNRFGGLDEQTQEGICRALKTGDVTITIERPANPADARDPKIRPIVDQHDKG